MEHHASKLSMLSVENDQLENEVNRLYNLMQNQGKHKDWDKDVHDLRIEVAQFEQQLATKLEHDVRKEKITTITYIENPEHQKMRVQKEKLAAEVSQIGQKIKFMENRMALGTQNYESVVTSLVDNSGQAIGEKRSLRKSNRSKQNANIIHGSSQQINYSGVGQNSLIAPNANYLSSGGMTGVNGQGIQSRQGLGGNQSQVISGGNAQMTGVNGQGIQSRQGLGIQGSGYASSMNYSQSMNQGGGQSRYEESQFYR